MLLRSAGTDQDCWHHSGGLLVLSWYRTSAPLVTPTLIQLLMGCTKVPVVTLQALGLVSKGTEGLWLHPQVLPPLTPAHQLESEHLMRVSSI